MSATIHKLVPKPLSKYVCPGCGVAMCDCGMAPIERAAAAVAANPEKSDRSIAADIGVSDKTVAAARKTTADHSAVRRGADGVVRKMPARKAKVNEVTPGEIHEATRGFKAMMVKAEAEEDIAKSEKRRVVAFQHFKFLIVHNRLPELMGISADEIIDLLRKI